MSGSDDLTLACSAIGPNARRCVLPWDHPTTKPVETMTDHDFSGPVDEAIAAFIAEHDLKLPPEYPVIHMVKVPDYNAPAESEEFPEVELARSYARKAEERYRTGYFEQAGIDAAMATMFIGIATYKETRRG